jgi:hypothetical protein
MAYVNKWLVIGRFCTDNALAVLIVQAPSKQVRPYPGGMDREGCFEHRIGWESVLGWRAGRCTGG